MTPAIILLLFTVNSFGQNNTSPYSILGIGDIETGSYGKWSGMGNTGVALYSNRYLNQANPASLSMLDDQFFNFEIAGRYKNTSYKQTGNSSNEVSSADISMQKAALAIKLAKKWGTSVGFVPFSTSNYSFYSAKTLQGSNETITGYYSGSGGLQQVYWSNAYSINKNLRAGIQAGFLFGSLQQQEELLTSVTSATYTTTRNIYMTSPYITYGLQYNGKVSKKLEVALGGTYASATKLNADYSYTVNNGTSDIISDETVKNSTYSIPSTTTAGIALIYDKRLTLTSDYKHQDWSTLNYKGLNYSLVNSNRYAAGFEISKNIQTLNGPYERFFYQAGIFYNDSYLKIKNEQLKDYGLTLGFGLNSIRNSLGLSTALQIGTRGTTNNGLIRENYTQVTFTLSYRDFWFTKGRKYD